MWNLEKNKANIAMIDENGNAISYEEIQTYIDRIRVICSKRHLVLCLCKNTLGSITGYLAFIELRLIPILLEYSMEKDLMVEINANYDPYYIWAPEEINFEQYSKSISFLGYSLWKKKEEKMCVFHPDLAVLLSTSGTTGSSKMVRLSYCNLMENAHSIINYLNITEKERAITVLPMCYAYGLSIINTHIMSGATLLVINNSIIDKRFWKMAITYKATSLSGVPYTYQLLERMNFCKWNLPHLKTLTQAGGKLSKKLQSLFAEYATNQGKNFIVMYGQCEATARISFLASEFAKIKLGSIGKAIPNGELCIVNENGKKIEYPGHIGELQYNGPNVMMGYAKNALDLQIGDVQGECLLTGDMGYFDEDGFYYIVGRKKRFVKMMGKRVSLDELENYLMDRQGINCVCIEKNDRLIVFLTDINQKKKVLEILAKVFKLPEMILDIREILEIPRTNSGKIKYSDL